MQQCIVYKLYIAKLPLSHRLVPTSTSHWMHYTRYTSCTSILSISSWMCSLMFSPTTPTFVTTLTTPDASPSSPMTSSRCATQVVKSFKSEPKLSSFNKFFNLRELNNPATKIPALSEEMRLMDLCMHVHYL